MREGADDRRAADGHDGRSAMSSHDAPPWLPSCAICGDRLGVYEPLLIEHPDGSTVRSALLRLPEAARAPLRLVHPGCREERSA